MKKILSTTAPGSIGEHPFETSKLKKSILILKALDHPLRQQILKLIQQKEGMGVTAIYETLQLEQSVASQHLAPLRKAGFVQSERKGKSVFYTVNNQRINEVLQICTDLINGA